MLVTRAAVRPAEFSWTRSTDQPGPTSNGLLRVSSMPLILVTSSPMAKWRRKPGIRVLRCEPTLLEGMERIAHHIYGERGELDRVDPVSRQSSHVCARWLRVLASTMGVSALRGNLAGSLAELNGMATDTTDRSDPPSGTDSQTFVDR